MLRTLGNPGRLTIMFPAMAWLCRTLIGAFILVSLYTGVTHAADATEPAQQVE